MKQFFVLSLSTLTAMAFAADANAGYREVEVKDGGTISGTVTLSKSASNEKVTVKTDAATCGKEHQLETHVVGPNKGLANVVVYLEKVRKGKKLEKKTVLIDQKKCRYIPHVVAVPVGSTITVGNSDPVLHNTHTYAGNATLFNVALPKQGMRIPKVMDTAGLIRFKCDAGHGWMSAFAYVTDHPYVTVTGKDGKFELADIAPGKYTVMAWHEAEGEKSEKVKVEKSGKASVTFAF